MKYSLRMAVCALGLLWGTGVANAQVMPQDNWRYDGLAFTVPGPDAGVYKRSIAIGSGGVFVGQGNPATTIVQFQENGEYVRTFGTFGAIAGMACDATGSVYVLDRTDSKIKVFSKDGDALREWGEPGSEDGQFSLASWDGTTFVAVDTNDQVYVCDPGNSRVQVFNAEGEFLRKWGGLGTLPGQFGAGQPLAIAAGTNGWIYVGSSTATPPNLQVFDAQGNFVKSSNIYRMYVEAFAVTADGLLAANYVPYYSYIAFFDSSLTQFYSIPDIYTVQGIAFNARSDLYRVANNCVEVYEREYSSVQNSLLPPAIPQPLVIAAAQRAGTTKLDVDYTVTDADSPTVYVAALAFVNGGNTLNEAIPMSTILEGTATNIGPNQPVNTTRRITWDMAADWSRNFAQIQVEVLAKDSRNPLGVHWIRVPADGGKPAIEISRKPMSDAELLSLWYWFVATHNAGLTLTNGTVRGTTGMYNGVELASGTVTRTYGRMFAYEQMGVRAITPSEIARAQAGSYGFTSVDANSVVREAYALETAIIAWGYDYYKQCSGAGMNAFGAYAAIAAGYAHSLALMSDGTVIAWGYNRYGQLGDGTTTDRTTPVQVATGVAQVAARAYDTFFIKMDGSLWAMGKNGNGQLGDGSTTSRSVPVQVASNVTVVAAGEDHSLFVKTDGSLWAMGKNGNGQLGDGSTTSRSVPVQVASNVTVVAAGEDHSLFVKTDGSLWAMGNNGNGQLGDGSTTSRSVPVQVASNVLVVAAGGSHGLFIKMDGTLWAMGNNWYGQLGDGTTTQRTTPVQVATDAKQVSAAGGGDGSHSLFIKTNGSLWAMGHNGFGQLGDGTTANRLNPIQVLGTNVSAVAAGSLHSLALKKLHD